MTIHSVVKDLHLLRRLEVTLFNEVDERLLCHLDLIIVLIVFRLLRYGALLNQNLPSFDFLEGKAGHELLYFEPVKS